MIRVAVQDRHPALRAGLSSILEAAPGLAFAGAVGTARELGALVYRVDPDVVVVDDVAARVDGRARAVLYAATVPPELVLAAAIAGFWAVVDKTDERLLETIRLVAGGARVLPEVDLRRRAHAAARLDPRDRPIFAMRLAGTSPRDIAAVVGLGVTALNARIAAIVGQLTPAFG